MTGVSFAAQVRAIAVLCALALLGACQPPASAPSPGAPVQVAPDAALWFVCDAIDAPRIFTVRKTADEAAVLITEYDKANGAPVMRGNFELGAPVSASGSLYWSLLRDGAAAGNIRAVNSETLDSPGTAYTPPIRSLDLGARIHTCRWAPRTRLLGFDETRSILIAEDADGDLIYQAFDFTGAGAQSAIELSGGGRSTPFSLEVRGGGEIAGPGGVEYRFERDGHLYLIVAPTSGPATIEIWRGDEQLQARALIAHQLGGVEP